MNQSWKSFFEFMYKYFSDDRSRVAYLRTLITQITTCSNNETDLIVNYPDYTLKNWINRSLPKHIVSEISSRISYIELKNSMQRHFEQMNRTAKEVFFKDCAAQLGLKELRLKKWCKAISLLPSSLHYATSLQTLKSLSITCKRWSIVSCVHDSLLGHSSKRRECLSMKCVATNHSSF